MKAISGRRTIISPASSINNKGSSKDTNKNTHLASTSPHSGVVVASNKSHGEEIKSGKDEAIPTDSRHDIDKPITTTESNEEKTEEKSTFGDKQTDSKEGQGHAMGVVCRFSTLRTQPILSPRIPSAVRAVLLIFTRNDICIMWNISSFFSCLLFPRTLLNNWHAIVYTIMLPIHSLTLSHWLFVQIVRAWTILSTLCSSSKNPALRSHSAVATAPYRYGV